MSRLAKVDYLYVGLSLKRLLLVGQAFISSREISFSNNPKLLTQIVLPPRGNTRNQSYNHHHKISRVILIKEDPKATLNREHD